MPDIEFGVCDFHAFCGEGLEVCGLSGERWGASNDEMCLHSYTIDFYSAGFEGLDDV